MTAQAASSFVGPLQWRRIVDWLREDGVIDAEEAQRTVARCSQAESSQHPLVRLASVAMAHTCKPSCWRKSSRRGSTSKCLTTRCLVG